MVLKTYCAIFKTMLKKITLKDKILNHLTQKGKKTKSEKIFSQTLKKLQKTTKKETAKIIQSSLILSSKIFKTHTIKNKKNRKKKITMKSVFILDNNKRFSFAIKLIILFSRKNCKNYLYSELGDEILNITKNTGNILVTQKESHRQALKKKQLFRYYKWV